MSNFYIDRETGELFIKHNFPNYIAYVGEKVTFVEKIIFIYTED